jgi:hypothetical protein
MSLSISQRPPIIGTDLIVMQKAGFASARPHAMLYFRL